MIDNVLDLLWGNGIQPENVVMGCFQPDGVCRFGTGGMPGSCSDTAGVLTYQEIASRNSSLDVQTFYHPDTTVLYNVFEGSHRCLSGLMIWAIDQDTSNFTAMGELFGDYSHLQDPKCPNGYDYQTFHYNKPEAIWQYDTQYESNDRDPIRADGTVPDGSDAYGLMMLNGEEEAIDDNFQKSYTVVRRTVSVPRVKRDIWTKNQTVLERVFEYVEETFQVYCNFPPRADECDAVWNGGAEDTIIRLPDHVGEGPFARVISMMPVGNDYQLPRHHLQHRSLDGIHDNPVYEVKVDYNFHLARQDRGPVQIRVDFNNLLGYWS
ncbi:hypothetical protein K4K51_002076 [Colletotrichum sp. SAR 10_75]|nr:hypothetical protein K4K51_002076 [Colletotrichum sp. SAR 10_75]